MKIRPTNLANLLVFSLITAGYQVNARSLSCLSSYAVETIPLKASSNSLKKASTSPTYGEALNNLILSLNPDQQIVQLGLDNFHIAKKTDEYTGNSSKKQLVGNHLQNTMPAEVAELSLKRLAKEKILLGPIHEFIFRDAIGKISNPGTFGRKKDFLIIKKSIQSKEEKEILYKKEIAAKMFSELKSIVDRLNYDGGFRDLPYPIQLIRIEKNKSAFAHTSSVFDYKISPDVFIKNITLLIEITSLPGSQEFFEKIFFSSMESIYNVCVSRASGVFETTAEIAKYTILPSTITVLSQQGIIDYNSIGLLGAFTIAGSSFFAMFDHHSNTVNKKSLIPTLKQGPKSLWIKTTNLVRRPRVQKKLSSELENSTIDEATEAIKSSASEADKLDFDFGKIKYELANGIQKDIDVPKWSKEFSVGVSNLLTRLKIIQEELVKINQKVDPILNESQQINQNRTTFQREAIEALNELYGDKLIPLLIDLQAIEIDLITLAHSLDHYIQGLDHYAESKVSTPALEFSTRAQRDHLRNQMMILQSFAKPFNDYKKNIITILNILRVTTTSVQMNDIQSLSL